MTNGSARRLHAESKFDATFMRDCEMPEIIENAHQCLNISHPPPETWWFLIQISDSPSSMNRHPSLHLQKASPWALTLTRESRSRQGRKRQIETPYHSKDTLFRTFISPRSFTPAHHHRYLRHHHYGHRHSARLHRYQGSLSRKDCSWLRCCRVNKCQGDQSCDSI